MPNNEFISLSSTRDCLLASIADRQRLAHPTDGHVRVMKQEQARLAEVETRMKEVDPEAFKQLTEGKVPAAPAKSAQP